MAGKITVKKNTGGYVASVVGFTDTCDRGKTISEAVGNMVMKYPERFNINLIEIIAEPETVKMPYQGSFIVEIAKGAGITYVPKEGVIVDGQKIIVHSGTVQQVMGGIQLYSGKNPFCWGYNCLKAICTPTGQVIWKNWDYDKMD